MKKQLATRANIIFRQNREYMPKEMQIIRDYCVKLLFSNHHVILNLADMHIYLTNTDKKRNWAVRQGEKMGIPPLYF